MPESTRPVIVYGASGYTGRLICEYLREYNVPFLAAGRDADKVKASMESNVAGIETADYEVVEVDHDADSLAERFAGASFACNTVGPFRTLRARVVRARLGLPFRGAGGGREPALPGGRRRPNGVEGRAGLAHPL